MATPPSFPLDDFRAFGIAAEHFFPKLISDEDLNDPLHRRRHFDWSWQAVRYRYRSAVEANEEFKALLASPSELWQAGWGDEELTYKLERCIYTFFMSGLSIFESLGYCLYFLGGAVQPAAFPHIAAPRKISLAVTAKAFTTAFPSAAITTDLNALPQKTEFAQIQEFRNLLAHRISGRRTVRGWSDGKTSTHEETWHIPGATGAMPFSANTLQNRLDEVDAMLKSLITEAKDFAQGLPR